MYRINLYPEYLEGRRSVKIRLLKTGFLASLFGIVVLQLGSLVISSFILQGRVASISTVVSEQESQIQNQTASEQELIVAREVLSLRSKRIDWSPMLALLSEKIGDDLQLIGFEGVAERGRTQKKLTIAGTSRDESIQMHVFTKFVDTLRVDQRISGDFPNLRLGSVGGGKGTKFQILGDGEESGT